MLDEKTTNHKKTQLLHISNECRLIILTIFFMFCENRMNKHQANQILFFIYNKEIKYLITLNKLPPTILKVQSEKFCN